MTVHIKSVEPRGALGYRWDSPGAVVAVDDEHAQELLPIPGFSEVSPSHLPAEHHGKHEAPEQPGQSAAKTAVTEPGPDASAEAEAAAAAAEDETEAEAEAKKTTRSRKTAVTE